MKKRLSIPVCIAAMFLFSCRKEAADQHSNSAVEGQVLSWLASQKSPRQPNKAANIDLLSRSLDFSGLTTEGSHDGEKLLIIPVTARYVDHTVPVLVIRMTASGNIRDGNVVLYTPKNLAGNAIPANTFHAIINTGEPDCDGEFRFLSVTGRKLYTLTYEQKRLVKEAKVVDKGGNARSNCID